MAEYHRLREPMFSPMPPQQLNVADLSGEQLDALAAAILERNKAKKAG